MSIGRLSELKYLTRISTLRFNVKRWTLVSHENRGRLESIETRSHGWRVGARWYRTNRCYRSHQFFFFFFMSIKFLGTPTIIVVRVSCRKITTYSIRVTSRSRAMWLTDPHGERQTRSRGAPLEPRGRQIYSSTGIITLRDNQKLEWSCWLALINRWLEVTTSRTTHNCQWHGLIKGQASRRASAESIP